MARASHDVALKWRRLCDGALRGMFDGRSTVDVGWDGPLVVIDLSEFADDEGIPILMACATAWLNAAVVRPGAGRRSIVLDEAWRLLSHLGTARWLRASLKLARQYGVSNVLVMHRLTDLLAAGDADSEQVAVARGLLSDTQTRVIYGQPRDAIDATADLLGLSRHEADEIANLGRGVGLWKVGRTSHLVVHHIGEREWQIIDTDGRMRVNNNSWAARPGGGGVMRYDRDRILANVDLPVLADEPLGAHKGTRTPTWPCPEETHTQTCHTPPVTVFTTPRGEQRWTCHGCGASGTAIDLVMTAQRMDLRGALEWLSARAGVAAERDRAWTPASARARTAREEPPASPDPHLDDYAAGCERWLWSCDGASARAWLTRTRGLPPDLLRHSRIGFDPGSHRLDRPDGVPRAAGVVLPVLDADSRAVFTQTRRLYARTRERSVTLEPARRRRSLALGCIRVSVRTRMMLFIDRLRVGPRRHGGARGSRHDPPPSSTGGDTSWRSPPKPVMPTPRTAESCSSTARSLPPSSSAGTPPPTSLSTTCGSSAARWRGRS